MSGAWPAVRAVFSAADGGCVWYQTMSMVTPGFWAAKGAGGALHEVDLGLLVGPVGPQCEGLRAGGGGKAGAEDEREGGGGGFDDHPYPPAAHGAIASGKGRLKV